MVTQLPYMAINLPHMKSFNMRKGSIDKIFIVFNLAGF
jgi:hypothetical protein